ncbi:hypothetical protein WSM22_30660 [Cytophagales bacterium WSM2-2]|nr:hypothetical protein WSM22_30660 [Cytophagales bacterium WSM2-2]
MGGRGKYTDFDNWGDFGAPKVFDNDARNVSNIPEDVAKVFEDTDIDKVWLVLEKTFHVNVKEWKQRFNEEYNSSSRKFSKRELFVRFGKAKFEAALNHLLARKELTPTWINLVRYVVMSKIKAKQKEDHAIRNYYKK